MLKLFSLLPNPLTKRLIYGQSLLRNPFSLGVRIIVRNADDHVLLVRHSYIRGWYLPGGGVNGGEAMAEAAMRELREEAGISATEDLRLLGVYLNRESFGRDHIGLFEVAGWEAQETFLQPNAEILEARFFNPGDLPQDATRATADRIAEFCLGSRDRDPTGGGYW
ncbi:NUDIX domain-containing protein [Roseibium aggregatum]|uniref:NUDIX domain-containing protein n=1 Tax=Roseibium aggregatum TaxID=187304 RepID=A0A926P1I9_9HYPH|nr:NUDIX domain-containing protein [Roseibium aggregatum]MBD1547258.1 NUDIX domain-containing protein [Roseibium aggregatum]